MKLIDKDFKLRRHGAEDFEMRGRGAGRLAPRRPQR
jgi:hypothetical protein